MQIKPVDGITFGYSHPLKTLYKKGQLPQVKYGFYGDELTKENVTLEHLKCKSDGGKTKLFNLVLASANKNQERANRPLSEMLNWEFVGRYLEQFRNIQINDFNGNAYIKMILETVKKLIEK